MADTEWMDSPSHREGGGGSQRRVAAATGGGAETTPTRHPSVRGRPLPEPEPSSETSPSQSSVPMRQLEFTQAMNDFHHMFPSMDREVIEAVLRANNGIVDATIDQLLTMSIDNVEDDDDLPDHLVMSAQRDVALEAINQNTHTISHKLPKSRVSEEEDPVLEESPPSYTEAIKAPHVATSGHRHHGHHHHHRHHNNNRSSSPSSSKQRGSPRHHPHPHTLHRQSPPTANLLELEADALALSNTEPKSHLSSWQSATMALPRHSGDFSELGSARRAWADTHTVQSKRSALKTSPRHAHFSQNTDSLSLSHKPQHSRKVSWDTAPLAGRSKSFGGADNKRHGSSHFRHLRGDEGGKMPPYRNWNPPMLGTLPDDFLRLKPKVPQRIPLMTQKSDPGHHRHTLSGALHRSLSSREEPAEGSSTTQRRSHAHHVPLRSLSFAASSSRSAMPQKLVTQDISTDFIQRRMRENERRRRQASVDLDPELSQYLEDERLALILQNSEFLQELRDDETFMRTLERDRQFAADEYASAQEMKQKSILAAAAAAAAASDAEKESSPQISPPPLGPDDQEGYGDDRETTLEAFPFSQQLPKANAEDAEFLQKLRHMGKASKKQFAALARRFFSRKRRKSPRHLLRESLAPSMTNLLDEEEGQEEDNEGVLGTSPSTNTVPTYGAGRFGFRVDGLPPQNMTDFV